jgi:uncharacterized protein
MMAPDWRAFVKVGRDTRYESFSSVLTVLRRILNDLPSKVRLNHAKLLLNARVQSLRDFLAAIESEAGNMLYQGLFTTACHQPAIEMPACR